jgi:hypothetical protein
MIFLSYFPYKHNTCNTFFKYISNGYFEIKVSPFAFTILLLEGWLNDIDTCMVNEEKVGFVVTISRSGSYIGVMCEFHCFMFFFPFFQVV